MSSVPVEGRQQWLVWSTGGHSSYEIECKGDHGHAIVAQDTWAFDPKLLVTARAEFSVDNPSAVRTRDAPKSSRPNKADFSKGNSSSKPDHRRK